MANQQQPLDLAQLFGAVAGTLQQNRQSLNQADEYNHDHGDNMVDTFETITQAMRETRGAEPSDQMAYAAQVLRGRQSGSAQAYADGLSQASREFQGQQVTRGNALTLIQTLLGGGQAAPVQQQQQTSGGLGGLLGSMLGGQQQQQQQDSGLGDLLGSMLGGQSAPAPQQQSSGGLGDLLGSMLGGQQQQQQPQQGSGGLGDLLGSMLGGQQQQQQAQQNDGVGMGDLLKAGMAFMSTRARGGSNLEAIVNAIVASSALGSGYREQSSSLVVNTLLSVIQGMAGGR
jgi:hypothetical protein